ncbi:hypothetical protein FMO13_12175 [Xanthomonas phaseoli pv. dieffenbachiae]
MPEVGRASRGTGDGRGSDCSPCRPGDDAPAARLLPTSYRLTDPARLHKLAGRVFLASACLSWNTLTLPCIWA